MNAPALKPSRLKARPKDLKDQAKEALLRSYKIATPACLAVTASRGKWKLARHLLEMDREIVRFIRENKAGMAKERILIIDAPPRHGKALQVDTPIPTPEGWRSIRSLRVGDQVFAPSGKPCHVIATSPTFANRPVYTVATDDGDQILADADHEWVVRLDRKSKAITTRTTKYLADRTSPRNAMIHAQAAICTDTAELPIDPYVLGAWLGDGRNQGAAFCSADKEIIDELDRLEGPVYSERIKGITSHFRLGPNLREGCGRDATIQTKLRKLSLLHNKHIPDAYLWADQQQRKSLLQGLIDTDGYVAKDGQIEFCTTLENLAYQVKELVASLGHKASVIHGRATLNGKDCGPKYRVMFYMEGAARLHRKRKKCRHGKRAFRRYISVTPAGKADTCCIQVDDPSGMFLCGRSMLPTHNSEMVSHYLPAWHMGTFPEENVAITSYGSTVAKRFGGKALSTFSQLTLDNKTRVSDLFRLEINPSKDSASEWGFLGYEGFCYATGVGGPLTSLGFNLIIVDDPVKNQEDALSPTIRESVWNWYTSTALTRLEPKGVLILIATRWHRDDLSGRLLSRANTMDGEPVRHIHLPAISEHQGIDPIPDYLARPEGQPLWPERWPLDSLQRMRQGQPLFWWSAMYQGRPTSADEMEWPDTYFDSSVIWCEESDWPDRSEFIKVILAIDPSKGSKSKVGDYSAIVVACIHKNGLIYIDSSIQRRPVSRIITDTIALCNEHTPDMVGCEGNAFQDLLGPEFERETKGHFGVRWPIFMIYNTENKQNRIRSLETYLKHREFRFRHHPDNELLVGQLRDFPLAPHDDGPDALQMAISLPFQVGGQVNERLAGTLS